MITTRRLTEYVSAEPFRPSGVKMASGQAYEVRHPEMILVGRSSARFFPATDTGAGDKWPDLSLLLMEALEPIDLAMAR